jgi:hypothetical protein
MDLRTLTAVVKGLEAIEVDRRAARRRIVTDELVIYIKLLLI